MTTSSARDISHLINSSGIFPGSIVIDMAYIAIYYSWKYINPIKDILGIDIVKIEIFKPLIISLKEEI